MTATENLMTAPAAVVAGIYEAFGRGDIPGLLRHVHPDVIWGLQVDAPGAELVPMFTQGAGHEAVLHYFSGVMQLEFHVFDPRAFHVDGDVVLVELVMDFSHRETAKRVRLDEIHRFVVRDGQVVRYQPYCDTAAFIEAFRS